MLGISFISIKLKNPSLIDLILDEFPREFRVVFTGFPITSMDLQRRRVGIRVKISFPKDLTARIGSSEVPADTPAIKQGKT